MPEARRVAIPITYHTQYGTVPIGTIFHGLPLEEKHLPVLTYEGYKFIGWYYDEAFTQEAKVGDIASSHFYLYAKWVEVPTVKSKMTAIADEIRELSGTTGTMGLDAMADHIGEANTEVSSQSDLIAQIKSTVDSLPEANSGGVGYDTCTVNITAPLSMGRVAYLTVNADGELEPIIITTSATSYSFTCVCNSFVAISISPEWSYNLTNADYLGWIYSSFCRTFVITASSGETATITFRQDAGGAE